MQVLGVRDPDQEAHEDQQVKIPEGGVPGLQKANVGALQALSDEVGDEGATVVGEGVDANAESYGEQIGDHEQGDEAQNDEGVPVEAEAGRLDDLTPGHRHDHADQHQSFEDLHDREVGGVYALGPGEQGGILMEALQEEVDGVYLEGQEAPEDGQVKNARVPVAGANHAPDGQHQRNEGDCPLPKTVEAKVGFAHQDKNDANVDRKGEEGKAGGKYQVEEYVTGELNRRGHPLLPPMPRSSS